MTVRLTGEKVILSSIEKCDIEDLWQLIYGEDDPLWKQWDAPYYTLKKKSLTDYRLSLKQESGYDSIAKCGIWVSEKEIIGTVGYYWEHRQSNWLEVGISIYKPQYWSKGYGRESLQIWVSHLFDTLDLVRVGLTTWSGNVRMMRCAESVGMKLEGRLRRCRLWGGRYYDSLRYGVLREEWEDLNR